MTARVERRRWREVKRRPIQGNSPNDRMLLGPDCYRRKRVCADSFPATPPPPQLPADPDGSRNAFFQACGIYRSDGVKQQTGSRGAASRWSVPGPVQERVGRSAPCSSSATSSDRLFLDRVARQHCPSPLHRHAHTNTHSPPAQAKQDISTLRRIGHFYFALTPWMLWRVSTAQSTTRWAPMPHLSLLGR